MEIYYNHALILSYRRFRHKPFLENFLYPKRLTPSYIPQHGELHELFTLTIQLATVFICDKKELERLCRNRKRTEMVVDVLRRGVNNLEKYRSHPNILQLVHPLEENAYELHESNQPCFTHQKNLTNYFLKILLLEQLRHNFLPKKRS